MPDGPGRVGLPALPQVDRRPTALPVDAGNKPGPAVHRRAAQLVALGGELALVDASLDLAAVGVLADPDRRPGDASSGAADPPEAQTT